MQSATSTQRKIKVEVANSPRPAGEGEGRGFTRLQHQTLWCGLCQRFAAKKKTTNVPSECRKHAQEKKAFVLLYSLNCKSTFMSHKWEGGGAVKQTFHAVE